MAVYAALVSLMNTIHNIHSHPRLSTSLDEYQIESLGENLRFLLDFVESYYSHGGISKEEFENLEREIAAAAHEAEDVIESHVADQIHAGSNERSLRCLFDLQKVILDMASIKEKITKVDEKGFKDNQPKYSKPFASSNPDLTAEKTVMLGFHGYLMQLLDVLTGQQAGRLIIPIVGMGGIGKTTLARNVYEDFVIVQHFDVCAWVTVSQEYNVKEILLETLSCLRESTRKRYEGTIDDLGEQLYKILSGRRYLVVLDDLWSFEAWNEVKFFFPENYNQSRIVVTTRQSDLAKDFGSLGIILNFLDEDTSWDLFCEKAFAKEGCPQELEEIARKTANKCKGLPLSLVVIGGLLRKSSRTQEYWENVEKDLSSILNSTEDNQCLNILSLSYSHLPACLKPCFLYLGIFPEDHEIRVPDLIKLWVAEGFIKPIRDESLEVVAKGYVKDLIDRNLILVRKVGMNRKLKTFNIHDLLRDLCIKVAEKEKFFHVMRELDILQNADEERCIVIHGSIAKEQNHNEIVPTMKATSLARSVISRSPCLFSSKSRLLRVLHNAYADSDTILQQVNLRLLPIHPANQNMYSWSEPYRIPSTISLLWNLQTLIIAGEVTKIVAPSEIWEMTQLRHLNIRSICLNDPPPSNGRVLENLQTLWRVSNFRCSEEVCRRMPNIKKLQIEYDDSFKESDTVLSDLCLYNVGCLNKLESLSYWFHEVPSYSLYDIGSLQKLNSLSYWFGKVPNRDDLLQNLTFPKSLKKLSITRCGLHWNDLRIIGSLPNLEVLKMDWDSVVGTEWNPVEGEFLRLKYLRIVNCSDLIYWNADSSHFPVLKDLVLQYLAKLDEIPLDIGEIPTLERICVYDCNISTAISAMRILEEQESLGNESLQARVMFRDERERKEFMEKVEQEDFTNLNFQLYH